MSVGLLSKKYKPDELRSKDSQHPCYVRFVNNTEHKVFLMWLDYSGKLFLYSIVPSMSYFDVTTYVSHPWMFLDCRTLDHLVVNFEEVYFAELCAASSSQRDRKVVFITNPLLSLKKLALLAVRDSLSSVRNVELLDLPHSLQQELVEEVEKAKQRKANLGIFL